MMLVLSNIDIAQVTIFEYILMYFPSTHDASLSQDYVCFDL